jgi:hypothetical protein
MPGRKRGSRRFNSAVSSEKNKLKIDEFMNDVVQGTVADNIELAYVEKTLSNSYWSIKYYTQIRDKQNRISTVEHVYQASKSGNLLKSAAPIMVGSVVVVENISFNSKPQYTIMCVLDKESIKDFKKLYSISYENTLNKIKNGDTDLRLFWVDDRIFNQEITGNQAEDEAGIIFSYESDDKSEEEEEDKKLEKPKKRTFKTVAVMETEDNAVSDVDIDNI